MLRFHRAAFIGVFVALMFGVAVVQACAGLAETGIRAVIEPQRYAGTPIIVVGDRSVRLAAPGDDNRDAQTVKLGEPVRLDPAIATRIAALPGVARTIEDSSHPATVLHDGQPLTVAVAAHDWRTAALAPYRLTAGSEPGAGGVVVDAAIAEAAGLAPGDALTVRMNGADIRLTVTGIARSSSGDAAAPLFLTTTDLAAHGGPAGPTALGVFGADGTSTPELADRVRNALKGTNTLVLAGDDRGAAESPELSAASNDVVALGSVIGGTATLIVIFLVTTMLGVLVQDRRREIALLRMIGAAPRQVRRLVLGEALIVSAVASVAGCVLGSAIGRALLAALAGLDFAPGGLVYRQGFVSTLIALGVGIGVTAAAVWTGTRRAAKAAPLEVLSDAAVPRRWFSWTRLLFALLSVAGGVALVIVTLTVMRGEFIAATAGPTFLLWAIAVGLLAPPLAQAVVRPLGLVARAVSGLAGKLAMLNIKAFTLRFAAVVTPVMLATCFILGNYYQQSISDAATLRGYADSLRADFVLTSAAGPPTAGFTGQVRAVPGVATAADFVSTSGFVSSPYDSSQGDEGYPVNGVDAASATEIVASAPASGSLTDLNGMSAAISVRHADRLDRRLGDTFTMLMNDGAALDLKIVAMFHAEPGTEAILIPVDLAAAHTALGGAGQILVRSATGTPAKDVEAALRTVAAGQPGITVADRSALVEDLRDRLKSGASVNYLLLGLITAYTVIAVVNTLATETVRRRREFALQRLTGSSVRQVRTMVAIEAILAAAAGLFLGGLVSLTTLVPLSLALNDRLLPTGSPGIALLVIGSAFTLTVATALTATVPALRGRPIDALATE
jgi:putative ABC transport system permease protein